ncbi:MAG: stage II sporulation protein M [Capsulimonadales bacterium]|nr:stage II sporulation protein M [Capsulimonadales bacterium]
MNDFIEKRKAGWEELAAILTRAGGKSDVRRLSREDLRAIGPLYRRAAADLAYARLRGGDPVLLQHLNDLVTRAHGLLYAERSPGLDRFRRFVSDGFPRLLHRHLGMIGIAAGLFVLGGLVAAVLCLQNRENIAVFSEFILNRPDFYRSLSTEITDAERPSDAAFLMQNNIRVAIMAFGWGILGAVPTLLVLFLNGLPIGSLAVHQADHGYALDFWSFIAPHGVPELSAIFISGASGMLIGKALIAPGELPRQEAILLAGKDAIRLVFGTILLLILAGFIEAFLSPAGLPPALKFGVAALLAAGLALYVRRGAALNRAS